MDIPGLLRRGVIYVAVAAFGAGVALGVSYYATPPQAQEEEEGAGSVEEATPSDAPADASPGVSTDGVEPGGDYRFVCAEGDLYPIGPEMGETLYGCSDPRILGLQ